MSGESDIYRQPDDDDGPRRAIRTVMSGGWTRLDAIIAVLDYAAGIEVCLGRSTGASDTVAIGLRTLGVGDGEVEAAREVMRRRDAADNPARSDQP